MTRGTHQEAFECWVAIPPTNVLCFNPPDESNFNKPSTKPGN